MAVRTDDKFGPRLRLETVFFLLKKQTGSLKYAEGEKDAERYGTAWVQRTVSCQCCQDELF